MMPCLPVKGRFGATFKVVLSYFAAVILLKEMQR